MRLLISTATPAQNAEMSDADYVKQALSAAPKAIGGDAAVIRMDKDSAMRTPAQRNQQIHLHGDGDKM